MQPVSLARVPHRPPLHDAGDGGARGGGRVFALGGILAGVDTRNKILTLAEALELPPKLAIASGTFEILRAAHARELAEVRSRTDVEGLLVVVLPSTRGLLSARARAEMVAGLRMVDYVLIADEEDLDRLIRARPNGEAVRLETADARRTLDLIEHVHCRQDA